MRRFFDPGEPWHVLLVPFIPLLALLKSSLDISPPNVLIGPLLVAIAGTVAGWALLLPFAVGRRQAGFAASLLALTALSALSIGRFAEANGLGAALPVLALAVVAGAVVILRSRSLGALESTLFVNRIVLLTVVFLAVPIVWLELTRPTRVADPLDISAGASNRQRPDIYVIVLDAYARADVLRTRYSFENPLPAELRNLGFSVADDAMANYAQTALSLASALNLDYLPALKHPERPDRRTRRGLGDLIRSNRFFSAFAAAGYETTSFASEYAMVRPNAERTPAPSVYLNEFAYATFESTVLPALFEAAGSARGWLPLKLHRHHLQWTLEHLAALRSKADTRPALVFAHLLAPHPPFAFDEHGEPETTRVPALFNDGDAWGALPHANPEAYKAGYLNNVRFVNKSILRVVENIIARRGRPSIIVIHSDHGPGSGLHWNSAESSDMRERLGILLAVRFPDGEAPVLGAPTSLINAYRVVLNRALGADLPYLEDEAFFSTWTSPFAYTNVTARVVCAPCG